MVKVTVTATAASARRCGLVALTIGADTTGLASSQASATLY
jgi:hypothetical protein